MRQKEDIVEIGNVGLLFIVIAFISYFLGRSNGRKIGRKDLFNEICDPVKKWTGKSEK